MNTNSPNITVLMATMNGAAFIKEQFDSLAAQFYPNIDVWVSDDGSTDGTQAIVQSWKARWRKGSVLMVDGPCQGFAANFRSMIIDPRIDTEYFAFCDQDDIWEAEKLETAVRWMQSQSPGKPLLFCSRTATMSEWGGSEGFSPLFKKPPAFRNALVQSLAGGNTMVINREARALLAKSAVRTPFVSHDWWSYLIVTGAGGLVQYYPEPLVRYRQHSGNQVGANVSWRARISRLKRLLEGQFADWTDNNLYGLAASRDLLVPDARRALSLFIRSRRGSTWRRLYFLRKSGVYRQTALGTLALYLAFITRRI